MNDNKAFAVFMVASCIMVGTIVSIQAYQGGKTNQLDKELQIEKEKTKQLQLQHEQDSTNTER